MTWHELKYVHIRHVPEHVLGHMLEHILRYVLKHVPGQVPKHVLRHVPTRHVPRNKQPDLPPWQ